MGLHVIAIPERDKTTADLGRVVEELQLRLPFIAAPLYAIANDRDHLRRWSWPVWSLLLLWLLAISLHLIHMLGARGEMSTRGTRLILA